MFFSSFLFPSSQFFGFHAIYFGSKFIVRRCCAVPRLFWLAVIVYASRSECNRIYSTVMAAAFYLNNKPPNCSMAFRLIEGHYIIYVNARQKSGIHQKKQFQLIPNVCHHFLLSADVVVTIISCAFCRYCCWWCCLCSNIITIMCTFITSTKLSTLLSYRFIYCNALKRIFSVVFTVSANYTVIVFSFPAHLKAHKIKLVSCIKIVIKWLKLSHINFVLVVAYTILQRI